MATFHVFLHFNKEQDTVSTVKVMRLRAKAVQTLWRACVSSARVITVSCRGSALITFRGRTPPLSVFFKIFH